MEKDADLFEIIKNEMNNMSKGHRALSEYIIDNFDKAVFLTAAKLGKVVGISESTVVRYATALGFKGFPEFQEAMKNYAAKKLSSIEKIDISGNGLKKDEIITKIMNSDIEKINLTLEIMDAETFESALNIIDKSRRIYICGIRNSAALAAFLAFQLKTIYDDVILLTTNSMSELLEQIIKINEKDCFIGIGFPRYSMRTLKTMEYANNKSAKVIAITDSINSPMCLYSSCNLIAKSEMTDTVDSLVAPMSLLNAVIVALSIRNKEKVIENLNEIDEAWEDYQVFSKDEINRR